MYKPLVGLSLLAAIAAPQTALTEEQAQSPFGRPTVHCERIKTFPLFSPTRLLVCNESSLTIPVSEATNETIDIHPGFSSFDSYLTISFDVSSRPSTPKDLDHELENLGLGQIPAEAREDIHNIVLANHEEDVHILILPFTDEDGRNDFVVAELDHEYVRLLEIAVGHSRFEVNPVQEFIFHMVISMDHDEHKHGEHEHNRVVALKVDRTAGVPLTSGVNVTDEIFAKCAGLKHELPLAVCFDLAHPVVYTSDALRYLKYLDNSEILAKHVDTAGAQSESEHHERIRLLLLDWKPLCKDERTTQDPANAHERLQECEDIKIDQFLAEIPAEDMSYYIQVSPVSKIVIDTEFGRKKGDFDIELPVVIAQEYRSAPVKHRHHSSN